MSLAKFNISIREQLPTKSLALDSHICAPPSSPSISLPVDPDFDSLSITRGGYTGPSYLVEMGQTVQVHNILESRAVGFATVHIRTNFVFGFVRTSSVRRGKIISYK